MGKPPSSASPQDAPHEDSLPAARREAGFPIVGIGCSAGGLEALEALLSQVIPGSGMAFVVVQHLDPLRESSLPALLQRITPLPVLEAADGMVLKAEHVYVLPPAKEITLEQGRLCLREPVQLHGLRLPIDLFLQSLAQQLHERAIAILLSGMGSDGLQGLRAIKQHAGLTLVQDPAGAKAASMPRSAIEAGLADIVCPAGEMHARLLSYLHRLEASAVDPPLPVTGDRNLATVLRLLHERSGQDFSQYKENTLYRRIERRAALHQAADIAAYAQILGGNPQEIDLLFKELLIGVTEFFRDAPLWQFLATTALPALLDRHPGGRPLRAWVPACSSGEEAFSLAIVFKETLARLQPCARFSLQIYATDLDGDAIARARKGVYARSIAAQVAPERLARYFVAEEGGYRISGEIREMVVFATQNLVSDPPFINLDILSCRNLLIYLGPELQKRLLPLFHYALAPDGLLLLGSAETVGSFSELFTSLDAKSRVFRRSGRAASTAGLKFLLNGPAGGPLHLDTMPTDPHDSLEQLTDQLIQQRYAPAAVLVNAAGDILYISGRTGKYLEPAAGKVNVNLHAMAREGLRAPLIGLLHKALQQPQPIQLKGLQLAGEAGMLTVDLSVQGLERPELLRGLVLVVFQDVATPVAGPGRRRSTHATKDALQRELEQSREALQLAHEQMQNSLTQLKFVNADLQATNEELQSTNEELTTSKEELQSLNEELQTVNAELQSKVDDLSWVRNDMTNLLNSTEIATIFLDRGMKLRRFTSHVTRLFKLIPGDVGRPLSDIVSELSYPKLIGDALEVLSSLLPREQQVHTSDGRWYRVRIMPYRTLDDVIDGVVITFIETTEIKQLEAELKRRQS